MIRNTWSGLLIVVAALVGCRDPIPRAGDSCSSLTDCVGGDELSCSAGECKRIACARTAQCPARAACANGVCTVPECEVDEDCPSTQLCFEGDCRSDLCQFKAECEPGEVCIGTPPRCLAPPERCESDRECPSDTFCKLPEGTCEARCTSDARCPASSYCDGEFCRLTCTGANDCAAGEYCVDGRCVVSECADRECPDDRPFLDPIDCGCVACLSDFDCRSERNERCDDTGQCRYCPVRASAASACTQQALTLVAGCCSECASDADCAVGRGCDAGRCVLDDPRDCQRDDDCPVDSRCDLGFCVEVGSATPCERQVDCPADEACHPGGECRPQSDLCPGCTAPNRCWASPGADLGVCAGCVTQCAPDGCPSGYVCHVPTGAAEGYCAALETVAECTD